jgi:hypothetical protein
MESHAFLLIAYLAPMLASLLLSCRTIHQEGYVRLLDLLVLVTLSLVPFLNICITLFYLVMLLGPVLSKIDWNKKVWIKKP